MGENEKIIIRDIIGKQRRPPLKPAFKETPKQKAPARRGSRLRLYIWISGVAVGILGFILIVNALALVLVRITPSQEFIEIDTVLKGAGENGQSSMVLPLEIMRLETIEKKIIKTTGIKEIEQKAKGQIQIFNAFSSQPQTLSATTRFETPQGKIYRIPDSIVVPGAKVEQGKIIPSSTTVTVFADQPGEDYNIGLTDFVIPGFKGTIKYEKFYARSKTEMTGGFVGKVSVASEEDLVKARDPLRQQIKEELLSLAKAKTPEGFLFYDPAVEITFFEEGLPEAGVQLGEFESVQKGMLLVFLLSRQDLERALARVYLGEEAVDKVEILNIDKLTSKVIEKNFQKPSLTFSISGQAHFVWFVEEETLKQDLVLGRKDYQGVFQNYPVIKRAEVVFKPAWWKFFPRHASKIKIERVLE